MNTAEMWTKAQNDGKVYKCINGDMAYSKKYGLTYNDNFARAWGLEAWKSYKERGIDDLLSCEWKEVGEVNKVMTIEEAEEKFGIKIINI